MEHLITSHDGIGGMGFRIHKGFLLYKVTAYRVAPGGVDRETLRGYALNRSDALYKAYTFLNHWQFGAPL